MSEDETIAEHERLDAQARAIESGDLDPAEAVRENEVIAELDAMCDDDDRGDPECMHCRADDLLLMCCPPAVADAWRRAQERVGFWYA